MAKTTQKKNAEQTDIDANAKQGNLNGQNNETSKITCGIVMPISQIDGYSLQHWLDVRGILEETAIKAGFLPEMVNKNDEIGVIHKRIIQNLYNNEILICDVSGKNLNVMFELGMRLAFDKPTIVIKDDETEYSFDIAPLEHIQYPKDLRYNQIQIFKNRLQQKLESVYKSSKEEGYSTFLQNFGNYQIKGLENQEISSQDFLIKELKGLRKSFEIFKSSYPNINTNNYYYKNNDRNSNINITERLNSIKVLIAKGDIIQALNELIDLSESYDFQSLGDEIILVSSQFNHSRKDYVEGKIDAEELLVRRNITTTQILGMLRKIEELYTDTTNMIITDILR